MNDTSLIPAFLLALVTAIGIIGIGHCIWSCLKREWPASDFKESKALILGISWFLGYFIYEGILLLAATIHFFSPVLVLSLNALLTASGMYWLFSQRTKYILVLRQGRASFLDIAIFLGLSGFVLFWNMHPSYDVDSLAFYFAVIKQWLNEGGKTFSRFNDIRFSVPVGENYLYAIGFALQPHSTFFQQIIHALSKIMLMSCVWGGLRSLNTGIFALVAVALIVSEEHLLASGANTSVRINMPITASVFLMGYGLFIFLTRRNTVYLALSLIAGFNFMSCKYLGIAYLIVLMAVIAIWLVTERRWKLINVKELPSYPVTITAVMTAAFFAAMPYLYNWIMTGTPVYPAAIGPLVSPFYDSIAASLARDWHYHLSLSGALKNLSVFMVWPGILPCKVLLPLGLGAGLLFMLTVPKEKQYFMYGIAFMVMSVMAVILTQTYMVFEMRYYRYGIGLYAASAALLMFFIFQTMTAQNKILTKIRPWLAVIFVLLICKYSIGYSFDVMRASRPNAVEVKNFLTGKITVEDIIASRLPEIGASYKRLQEAGINPNELGFLLSFSWPQTYYPVKGKNIAFINSGAFSTVTYFDKGLFAQALLKENITVIFNRLVRGADYPVKGGAVYQVLNECGKPSFAGEKEIIYLSKPCLINLAGHQDLAAGERRLSSALKEIEALPQYEPFNLPNYGGPSNLIK